MECRKDSQSWTENQEQNPQKSMLGKKISRNGYSEGKNFLTTQLSRKERSQLSASVPAPESRDEAIIDKKGNNLTVSQSFNKQKKHEHEEQNQTTFGNKVNDCITGTVTQNGGENEPLNGRHSKQSALPNQPVIRDITDFMDVHTLYSSLLANNACLERMVRRVDVAMETLSKSMRYAKRRQGPSLDHSSTRTSKNKGLRKAKSNGTGKQLVNNFTDGRREGRPGPGRADGTSGSPLPGKPRICWQ